MLDQKTKRKIDSARDILVGKVPDPKAQVEQITTALIYKFMDDMDKEAQELGGKPRFFTNGYKKFAWTKLMDPKLGGHDRLDLYVEAITSISQNPNIPQLFRDIFNDAFLPYRNPETLGLFLKEINGFAYDNSEDLGNAYEYLLSILGSQGDAGQFRTPRHIIDFIVSAVDPKKDETVCDPACGTAGFLISAYKHILKQHDGIDDIDNKEKPLTPDERKTLMEHFAGYDISPDMVRISKVNLYLHGFPSPTIFEYDTLSSEEKWDESFDVMLANPPFMTPKGGIRPHKRFSVQSNRSEVLFVDYILEHLRSSGRAGIIVPEGIIFQSGKAYKALRKMLVDDGLFAVVSLPAGVFNPYSGVKTSILLFDNTLAKKTKDILFLKIVNDGYDLGAQRREIDKNDLPLALEIIKKYKEALKEGKDFKLEESEKLVAHFVVKEKIAEDGDYNLSGDRYIEVVSFANQKWPMVELGQLEKQDEIEFLRGQGISKKDISLIGKNKCIHYGELYTLYQPIINEVFSKTDFEGKVLSISGDVLVPSTTTADAMGIAIARALNENGVILGGDINIIRTRNKKIYSKFLSWLLNSPLKKQLASYAKGVNILHISNKDIKQIKIPLPPLEVQKEIVEQIEKHQNIIDGVKQIVDNWKPKIDIDREWDKVKIGEICKIERGASPRPIDKFITEDPSGLNWIKIGDTKNSYKYITQTNKRITIEGAKRSRKVFIGDFVLSNSMSFGHPYIMKTEGYIHDGWLRLSEDGSRIGKDYLYYILESDIVIMQFEKVATGGVVKNLNSELVRNVEIPLPPLETQKQIVEKIEDERTLVESSKKLIEIYEQKIADVLNKI